MTQILKLFLFFIIIFGFLSSIFNLVQAATDCPIGQGWCIEVSIPGLKAGTPVKDPGVYFEKVYIFAVALGAILAVVMIIYGGFIWMTSPAVANIQKGKDMIYGAISGLILLLASYLILYTINPELVGLSSPAMQNVNIDTGNTGGSNNSGGGGNTGGGGSSTNNIAQTIINTVNSNPGVYSQFALCYGSTGCEDADTYILNYTLGPENSAWSYHPYNYPLGASNTLPSPELLNIWHNSLDNGNIVFAHVLGGGSGQHWILILGIDENNNITSFDPADGLIHTDPLTYQNRPGWYYFGSPINGVNDGWGGYVTVP